MVASPPHKPGADGHDDNKHASVLEYANTCVEYVRAALGVQLDFSYDTLPLLDHYLRDAQRSVAARPESLALVATVAGAYIGEVIRRRHPSEWVCEEPDPLAWSLRLHEDLMTVFPMALAQVAILGASAEAEVQMFAFRRDELALVRHKLRNLPAVSEEEYLSPSARVEVIDIVADLLREHRRKCDPHR